MESLFEPSSYLDQSPYDSSSFLTFSSFADLTASPPSISDTWDDIFYSPAASSSSYSSISSTPPPCSLHTNIKSIAPHLLRTPYSTSSDCSSPDLSFDPFEIGLSAFDLSAPGIFHQPSKVGNTKLSAADVTAPGLTHRVTPSTDSNWDSPLVTPALTIPGYVSPVQNSKSAFSWEDAPSSLASSSNYTPPTTAVASVPLRVASNPSLGAHKNPRAIRNVTSMPALKEEVDTFQWFDGTSLDDVAVTDENLVDNFDWVFGDYGLGDSLPMEGTIFAAFKENESVDQQDITPVTSTTTSTKIPSESTFSIQSSTSPRETITDNYYNNNNNNNTPSWYQPSPEVTQVVNQSSSGMLQNYSFGQMYTIDPLSLGGSADETRPASAPGAESGESVGMLSAPLGQMSRSLTAPGMVPTRTAPSPDVYTFTPQSAPTHYIPQQIQQQQSYAPSQVLPVRHIPLRRASHGLTISINQPTYSTYAPPSDLPPMPHSAPFSSSSMVHAQAQAHSAYSPHMYSQLQAPVAMSRTGSQPLPAVRRGSTSGASSYNASGSSSTMPAHLVRAQAIVQMQEAKEEAQRQEHRRQAASRRVSMAESSVMQPLTTTVPQQPPPHLPPQTHQPRAQPSIVGWGGPSSLPAQSNMPSGMGHSLGPALTTQPLIVHPPPQYYSAAPPHTYHPQQQQFTHPPQPQQQAPHRVHPPPHPGQGAGVGLGVAVPRPMARLPSSPTKARKVTSPTKRSPSGVKARRAAAAALQAGGFSWGEATFINFTPDDAEKLLTGVAPSGTAAKRKREEDAQRVESSAISLGMAGGEFLATGVDMDRDGSKRSRSE